MGKRFRESSSCLSSGAQTPPKGRALETMEMQYKCCAIRGEMMFPREGGNRGDLEKVRKR